MDEEIETMRHDQLRSYDALVAIAEALPALGIVAAVLGVIKAMGALDREPEILGSLIGAALVGTFAGIFFSYAIVSPVANKLRTIPRKEDAALRGGEADAAGFHNGAMPQVALEHGRKAIRPTSDRRSTRSRSRHFPPDLAETRTTRKEAA